GQGQGQGLSMLNDEPSSVANSINRKKRRSVLFANNDARNSLLLEIDELGPMVDTAFQYEEGDIGNDNGNNGNVRNDNNDNGNDNDDGNHITEHSLKERDYGNRGNVGDAELDMSPLAPITTPNGVMPSQHTHNNNHNHGEFETKFDISTDPVKVNDGTLEIKMISKRDGDARNRRSRYDDAYQEYLHLTCTAVKIQYPNVDVSLEQLIAVVREKDLPFYRVYEYLSRYMLDTIQWQQKEQAKLKHLKESVIAAQQEHLSQTKANPVSRLWKSLWNNNNSNVSTSSKSSLSFTASANGNIQTFQTKTGGFSLQLNGGITQSKKK
ncbi:hypothetical protein RFI_22429, partial [Reticulomyxa filosa]